MKRLTIHLNRVAKNRKGIQNTLSFLVSDDDEVQAKLSEYKRNVAKWYVSNIN